MKNLKIFYTSILFLFYISCSSFKETPLIDCKIISGMPGPEDMALDKVNNVLYISSHERRNMESIGKLFYISLNSNDLKPIEIITNYPHNFRPHGMSITNVGNITTLYVISHPKEDNFDNSIEVFEVQGTQVFHKKTLIDESLISPNDLFALPDGKIFVSNDRGSGGTFINILALIFGINTSKIAYFNGSKWSVLNESAGFGNGILYLKNNEKEIIYRAGFWNDIIYKYEFSTKPSPNLKLIKKIDIKSGPDNIEIDDKNNLYVVAHPSINKFLNHATDKNYPSPTQVFKIENDKPILIYANSGKEISAGSTAISHNGKLWISQVFNDFILSCPLK